VTDDQQSDLSATEQAQQSLSGLLDTPELLRVRIRPADFARALGVSKQSVSRWVRDGWVQLAADGRLDPTVAIGQLLRRCDPGRLRARWLRQAVTEVQELREAAASADARVAEVEARLGAELAAAHRRIEYLDHFAADLDCMLEGVLDLMRDSELALRGTRDTDEGLDLVDRIEGAAAEACGPEDWSMPDELDALAARDTTTQGGAGE
jgi:hypothetical protein